LPSAVIILQYLNGLISRSTGRQSVRRSLNSMSGVLKL